MLQLTCPFCSPNDDEMIIQSRHCYARWDAYPVSDGHMLVVPFRHIQTLDDAIQEEKWAMLDMMERCTITIEERLKPDGMNIGVNIGKAAGQTVEHIHIHVIPRYLGDVEDPRGGVRSVIPSRCAYPLS